MADVQQVGGGAMRLQEVHAVGYCDRRAGVSATASQELLRGGSGRGVLPAVGVWVSGEIGG